MGEMTFWDHVGLEITVVSGGSPLREAGRGPSELLPSPLSLPHLIEAWATSPPPCPSLHPTTLSLSLSWSLSAQHQTLFLQARWWSDTQPGIFSLQRTGGRRLEGREGFGSLALGQGPCWQRP